MAGSETTLKAREFLFAAEENALAILGPERTPPHRKVMWTVLQLHFGEPAIHFELQPQPSRGTVEVGLHFEGPPEVNDAWAAFVASRAPEFLGELGPAWELEAWTASWRRLHRSLSYSRLDRDLAREAAREYAHVITLLGPVVAAGLRSAVAERPPAAASRSRLAIS